jgi:hypothetical protein
MRWASPFAGKAAQQREAPPLGIETQAQRAFGNDRPAVRVVPVCGRKAAGMKMERGQRDAEQIGRQFAERQTHPAAVETEAELRPGQPSCEGKGRVVFGALRLHRERGEQERRQHAVDALPFLKPGREPPFERKGMKTAQKRAVGRQQGHERGLRAALHAGAACMGRPGQRPDQLAGDIFEQAAHMGDHPIPQAAICLPQSQRTQQGPRGPMGIRHAQRGAIGVHGARVSPARRVSIGHKPERLHATGIGGHHHDPILRTTG